MNILVLDDELNARESIKDCLEQSLFKDLHIQEAGSIEDSLEILKHFKPDLAILDVNLGNGTSFDLLNEITEINFKIIFISAYDEYAIKAFRYNAIDYILKPVNPQEFNEALKRVIHDESLLLKKQLDKLTTDLLSTQIDKLVIKDLHSIYFLNVQDIVSCKSENSYTIFSLLGEEDIIISKTLGDYEEILHQHSFFRCHRSYLINLKHIKKYDKREGGGVIEMKNGKLVPLSRNKRAIFLKLVDLVKGVG